MNLSRKNKKILNKRYSKKFTTKPRKKPIKKSRKKITTKLRKKYNKNKLKFNKIYSGGVNDQHNKVNDQHNKNIQLVGDLNNALNPAKELMAGVAEDMNNLDIILSKLTQEKDEVRQHLRNAEAKWNELLKTYIDSDSSMKKLLQNVIETGLAKEPEEAMAAADKWHQKMLDTNLSMPNAFTDVKNWLKLNTEGINDKEQKALSVAKGQTKTALYNVNICNEYLDNLYEEVVDLLERSDTVRE